MKVRYRGEEIELDLMEENEATLDYLPKLKLIKVELADDTREISTNELDIIKDITDE